MAKGIIVLKKRWTEGSKNLAKIVYMSFLVVSVATLVTTVNREYFYDRPLDQDDLYIVKPVDRINNMQSAVFKMVEAAATIHNKQYYNNNNSMILATLQGQEAIKILEQLQEGNIIHFEVTYDEMDNPVIELIKDTIVDNIPDDKKEFTAVSKNKYTI